MPRSEPSRAPASTSRSRRLATVAGLLALLVAPVLPIPGDAAGLPAEIRGDTQERGTADQEVLDRGRRIYRTQCQSCHGTEGKGDGPASRFLDSPPADLTDDDWKVAEDGSLEEIVRVIREGVEGTGMEPMGEILDEDELRAVAVYVFEVVAVPEEEEDEDGGQTETDGGGGEEGPPSRIADAGRH